MRLYLSDTLRPFDAGIMELGLVYTDKMAIPPGVSQFSLTGHCLSECTKKVISYELFVKFIYILLIICPRFLLFYRAYHQMESRYLAHNSIHMGLEQRFTQSTLEMEWNCQSLTETIIIPHTFKKSENCISCVTFSQ